MPSVLDRAPINDCNNRTAPVGVAEDDPPSPAPMDVSVSLARLLDLTQWSTLADRLALTDAITDELANRGVDRSRWPRTPEACLDLWLSLYRKRLIVVQAGRACWAWPLLDPHYVILGQPVGTAARRPARTA